MGKILVTAAVATAALLAGCGGSDDASLDSMRQNVRNNNNVGGPGSPGGGLNNAVHTAETGCGVHVNHFTARGDVFIQTNFPESFWVRVDAPGGDLLGRSDPSQPANFDGSCQLLWDLVLQPDGSQGFLPTTNGGGNYRVHVCTQSDFHASSCKSHNFRIGAAVADTWPVEVVKFYDTNEDALFNDDPFTPGNHEVVAGWKFEVVDELGAVVQTGYTGADGRHTFELEAGTWIVREVMPDASWFATVPLSLEMTVTVPPAPAATLEFGNACELVAGGHTKGWWQNKNGEEDFLDADGGAHSMALLNGYTLRDDDGMEIDFADYAQFRDWIRNARADNMDFMLSAQLAAVLLSIDNGYTDTRGYVGPDASGAWMTVTDLLAWAEALLVDNDDRADQEMAKDYLDAIVNGHAFTQPTAASCPFVYDDVPQVL